MRNSRIIVLFEIRRGSQVNVTAVTECCQRGDAWVPGGCVGEVRTAAQPIPKRVFEPPVGTESMASVIYVAGPTEDTEILLPVREPTILTR